VYVDEISEYVVEGLVSASTAGLGAHLVAVDEGGLIAVMSVGDVDGSRFEPTRERTLDRLVGDAPEPMSDAGGIREVGEGGRLERGAHGFGEREPGRGIEAEDGAQVRAAGALEREAIRLRRRQCLFVRQDPSRCELLEVQAREEAEPLVLLSALPVVALC